MSTAVAERAVRTIESRRGGRVLGEGGGREERRDALSHTSQEDQEANAKARSVGHEGHIYYVQGPARPKHVTAGRLRFDLQAESIECQQI